MTAWYYADATRERQGPVDGDALARLVHAGAVDMDSLVWRDGLDEWRPLRDVAGELPLSPPVDAAPVARVAAADASASGAMAPALAPVAAPAAADLTQVAPAPDPWSDTAATAVVPDAWAPTAPVASAAEASPYAPSRAAVGHTGYVQATGSDGIVYAGFLKRYAAMSIDGVVLAVPVLLILFIGAAAMGMTGVFTQLSQAGSNPFQGGLGIGFLLGVYVLPIFFQAAYFTWMQASGRQATLGKRAVGIKTVQLDGRPLGLGRSFGRFCAYFFLHLFTCGAVSLASAFMVGLGARKQAIHDHIAGSLVVDRWAFTDQPELQRRELGTTTVVVLVLTGLLILGYIALIIFAVAMGAAQAS